MIIDHFYLSILENLPQVILVASPLSDPETGQTDFLFEYVNPAWERVIGSPLQTIRGKIFSQTIYASSSIPWIELANEALRNEHSQQKTIYSEMLEKWLDVSTIPLTGNHICINISDVSELKNGEIRLKEQNYRLSCLSTELASSKNNLRQKLDNIENLNHNLEQLAYYDRLTQLPNRTRFTEILTDELEASKKANTNMALAVFDIDNLKILNDTLSHEAGDELIRQVAERLSAYTDHSIVSSRFGGDEFLLIIRNYEHDAELLHVVDSIQKMISQPYLAHGIEIKATVSIGVATFPDDSSSIKELLKYADIALSDAKKRGKNTLSLFHSVMQETLLSRIKMEKKIRTAFEEEAFQVFYQPQYDVLSKTLRGFEALVRWFDDELGYIAPDIFIPIAEETQIIIPLGKWIMRTACKTLREWQDSYAFNGIMSINVSPVQLKHSRFTEDLKSIVDEFQLPARSLEIEITEGILIDNFDESVRILKVIKNMGVGISLDDFGTGYSSLSYLQFLPLTTLKIDKSFIANITHNKSVEYDITDAIVSLVNKLGLDTIAEGVETDAQYEIMERINCKTIQGFLTGRPMHKGDCNNLIEKASKKS